MKNMHFASRGPGVDTVRSIARIALPAIVSNISVPLLSLVDTAIAGHLGSSVYLGAIAVGGMVFNVLYWLTGFLRMGTSGPTAQAFGRGDMDGAAVGLARAMALAMLMGTAIVLAAPLLRAAAFTLVSCPEGVEEPAVSYFCICIFGAPAVLGICAFSGWFLGMQNSVWPMVVTVVQNVVNIVASATFVFAFGMGIEGIAAGTVAGEYAGLAVCVVVWLAKYYGMLPRVDWREVFCRRELGKFFAVNRDIFLRTLFLVAVMSYFTVCGTRMGALTLAANALLMQLFVLFSYISDGFAFAAEALSGRYAGARDRQAFKRVVAAVALICGIAAVAFSAVYALAGHAFLALLTDSRETLGVALQYLSFAAAIPVVAVVAFILDGVFVGTLATRQMLVSTLLSAAVFFALLFFLLPVMGNSGLWTAFLSYLLVRSAVMALQYRTVLRRTF